MSVQITPLFAPVPGGPELLIILFIAVLLFGASKIPKLARSTGEAMGEFQKGREKAEQELEELRKTGTIDDGDDGSEFVETKQTAAKDRSKASARTEPET